MQATHAAIQATNLFPSSDPNLVVLECADRNALLRANEHLKSAGIDCALFFEPDGGLGFTALATGPIRGAQRRYLRGFRLWDHGEVAQRERRAAPCGCHGDGGSYPSHSTIAPVAQRESSFALNEAVVGSTPTGRSKKL